MLNRGWARAALPLLTPTERKAVATGYLELFRKRLEAEWLERLVSNPACATPLFLRTCVEELRVFGYFETLPQQIEYHLAAPDLAALIDHVLDRCERDFAVEYPGILPAALSLLAVSRSGLDENELLALLGLDHAPLPGAVWSPLLLSLSSLLILRSGLVDFAHQPARQSVERRYFSVPGERLARCRELANGLSIHATVDRQIQELPWLFIELEDWRGLYGFLLRPECIDAAYRLARLELVQWWRVLEQNSPYRAEQAYKPIVEEPAPWGTILVGALALLLRVFHGAWQLGQWIITTARKTGNTGELMRWLERQALVARDLRRYEAGLALLDELAALCVSHRHILQRCLGNQAVLLTELGRYPESLEKHRQEALFCLSNGDRRGAALSLLNQANVQRKAERPAEAAKLFAEAERDFRELGDWPNLQRTLGGLADLARATGKLKKALAFSDRQTRLCRETRDGDALLACLAVRANILMENGDYDAAEEVLREQESLALETGSTAWLAKAKAIRAMMYWNIGWLDDARQSAHEALQIAGRTGDEMLENGMAEELERVLD